jgi:pimeloyl-ACP methyl ester carboxylesterase
LGVLSPDDGLAYHGDLAMAQGQVVLTPASEDPASVPFPCVTVSLSQRGFKGIGESASELAAFVDFVKGKYRVRQVTLVGYSLGGLVCRDYLTSLGYRGEVATLMTIASPHLGSEYAALYDLCTELHRVANEPNVDDKVRLAAVNLQSKIVLELRKHGVNAMARSLDQMHPPEGDNYLALLNRRPHPADVHYVCLIGSKSVADLSLRDVMRDLRHQEDGGPVTRMAAFSALLDAGRMLLSLAENKQWTPALLGDGLVSAQSQDLRQTEFFQQHPEIAVQVIEVESSHVTAELQKLIVPLLIRAE